MTIPMDAYRKAIIDVCQRLDQRQFVANHDGNISVILENRTLVATPTSFAKKDITESDLLVIDGNGKVIEGKHKIFSEIAWHLAIYRVRPDVKCIVHGHPPTASGFGVAKKEIGVPGIPEAIVSLGRHILTLPFFSPTDAAIQQTGGVFDQALKTVLQDSDGFVAEGNGVWAVGNDPLHAYLRLELIEQVAKQHATALSMGRVYPVDELTVSELLAKRPKASGQGRTSVAPTINRDRIKEAVRRELEDLLIH